MARFLRVNPYVGLFYFDEGFRPVPLAQSFIGVKAINRFEQLSQMDRACFELACRNAGDGCHSSTLQALENVRKGYQVMVFVHARNGTVTTAERLRDIATQ